MITYWYDFIVLSETNKTLFFVDYLRFPKYLLHLYSSKTNLNSAGYYNQLALFKEKSLNDFQVQNIVKSLNQFEGFNSYNRIANKIVESRKESMIDIEKANQIKESYKKRFLLQKFSTKAMPVETNFYSIYKNENNNNNREYSSVSDSNVIVRSIFETSPPTGYKRPVTGMLKPIIKKPKQIINDEMFKRDVYLEAISQDQAAGHVFMKYLLSTNKTVSFKSSFLNFEFTKKNKKTLVFNK